MPTSPGATPPGWRTLSTEVALWHGSTRSAIDQMLANGIDLNRSRLDLDFGRGFYMTTKRSQAERWAQLKYRNLSPARRASDRPALLRFRVPRGRLAALDHLVFVRADASYDAYWSFVCHCRSSTASRLNSHQHPDRAAPNDWYDVVCGPVAARWPPEGRFAFPDSDQFSFHTAGGVAILDELIDAGAPAVTAINC